jgi:hypothetical protein
MLFSIGLYTSAFIFVDKLLNLFNLQGRYYFTHAIANMCIIYNTFNCMIDSYILPYTNQFNVLDKCSDNNIFISRNITYSIHFYHIIYYFNSLRYVDWIHHIIMVGLTLPLSHLINQNNLLGHSFFYIIGLPGMIDYIMLFLVKNNYMHKNKEKNINSLINLWIRCPGCISNVTLGIVFFINSLNILKLYEIIAGGIIILSIYWNGIYFMNQVVTNNIMN